MILLLDTSTPTCHLVLTDGDWRYEDSWEAGRGLAKGLLGYLEEQLQKNGKSWDDVMGIVAFRGPGSFTGLRIGLTVLNTIADARHLPIVGTTGVQWQAEGIMDILDGHNDHIVLPEYGSDANITAPRK